ELTVVHLGGFVDQMIALSHHRRFGEIDLTREGTDAQGALGFPHVGEPRDAVDVDEVTWAGETQLEERDEALPAREHLSILAKPGQEPGSLTDAGGSVILEAGRNHGVPPLR